MEVKKMEVPELLYPEDNAEITALDRFSWKSVKNASGYTLLLSPFRNFSEGVTIRLNVENNPEFVSLPLSQGRWFWTVAVDSPYPSDFGVPFAFTISQQDSICGDYNDVRNWQNYVFTPIPDNSDGSAVIVPFLEEPGVMSAIFTVNSSGKSNPVNGGQGGRVVLRSRDCRQEVPGTDKLIFKVMPEIMSDTSGQLMVSGKPIRMYIMDIYNNTVLDQRLDPSGKLKPGEWNQVIVSYNSSIIRELGFYVELSDASIPLDQRIRFKIKEISFSP
jgi:hypothetical protein